MVKLQLYASCVCYSRHLCRPAVALVHAQYVYMELGYKGSMLMSVHSHHVATCALLALSYMDQQATLLALHVICQYTRHCKSSVQCSAHDFRYIGHWAGVHVHWKTNTSFLIAP